MLTDKLQSAVPRPREPDLIQDIFPSNEIHIIGGPSGSGKSTLLFQWLADWQRGEPVLGHKSNPCPYVIVACDRRKSSCEATLDRIGLKEVLSPVIGTEELDWGSDDFINCFEQIVNHERFPSDRKLVVLEGMATLVPAGKINDYHSVSHMLRLMSRVCERRGLTVIGTMHNAKTSDNHRITNPRERILGSVAWSGFSDTLVLVEQMDMSKPLLDSRQVTILPRNSKGLVVRFKLDKNGRFTPEGESEGAIAINNELSRLEKIFEWVRQQPGEWPIAKLIQYAQEVHGINDKAV
ncbi:MAG: AAA family ATPase, partial [Bryobacteraceae bacterium]